MAAFQCPAAIRGKAIAGADRLWEEYGTGVLITSDPRYGTSGQGIPSSMGRVDSFAYDPENIRLFALIGTGGLWMSDTDISDTKPPVLILLQQASMCVAVGTIQITPRGGR